MALIPADVGLRLRLDNELLPQQIKSVQEISADLPRLQAGQVFTAQIREVLPEKTYLALVAGKTVTLSLPEAVQSGDVLELVVVDQTPKSIIAQLAKQPAAGAGAEEATTPHTTLSQAAQMLRSILIAEGETPESAPLNRGQPLLARPPQSGAELVQVLSKAVNESGLFYEAHQAQWVAGKLPLANLRQEPQGQHTSSAASKHMPSAATSPAASPALPATTLTPQVATPPLTESLAAAPPQTPSPAAGAPTASQTLPGTPVENETGAARLPMTPMSPQTAPDTANTSSPILNKATLQGILLYQENQTQEANTPEQHATATPESRSTEGAATAQPKEAAPPATASPAAAATVASQETTRLQANAATIQTQTMPTIPDDLRALVQQQLDAAGSQRLLWHGEVWPGQTMQWQLEWQQQGEGNGGEEAAEPWQTKLRLTTPRLGELEASLQLGVAGVRIAMYTPNADIAADMRAGATDLENALAAAGVPLRGFIVKHAQEEQE